MYIEIFEVTCEHLKLLSEMYVSWYDFEYGAPSIDCKRPYGNSDVVGDIAKALEWDSSFLFENKDEYSYSKEAESMARKIHLEMKKVLQILIDNFGIETGVYQRVKYAGKWKLIGD